MLEKLLNTNIYEQTTDALGEIRSSVLHTKKISHLTHNLYKYPACFHPEFPRSVIQAFSKENDWILDPFVGGGTTAVEALALGRNFIGSDLNDLAIFSSRLKTTIVTSSDLKVIDSWAQRLNLANGDDLRKKDDEKYFENIPKFVEGAARKIASLILKLKEKKHRAIATGALLRFCQLEIEQRISYRSSNDLLNDYKFVLNSNLEQLLSLSLEVEHGPTTFLPESKIFKANAAEDDCVRIWSQHNKQFKLVITSPPYPERHILYHKWQVNGRRESRLPYWLVNSSQYENEQFYTMSLRDAPASLEVYMSTMYLTFENLNRVMQKNGVIVQVVGFNDLAKQLPLYLAAMNEAGFEEIRNIDPSSFDGRLWRKVPNRRWFTRVSEHQAKCNELVLFHRKKVNA